MMHFFTPKHIIDVYDQSIVCPDIPTRAVMTSFSSELPSGLASIKPESETNAQRPIGELHDSGSTLE